MSFIHQFFEHLERYPSRAFVTEVHGERLERTYGGRLRDLALRGRSTLRAQGVEPGDRVVLLAPNGARWVAADLAMLAEGAIVVPMYARQAPKELAAMMRDAGPRLVVTADEGLAEGIRRHFDEAPILTFDAFFDAEPLGEPPRERGADDVVTLIYTSGTSGEPKGVKTTVGNVEYMLQTIDGRLGELMGRPGGSDRVFHYLPFCFAGSRFVLWSCLFRANGVMVSTDLNDLAREMKTAAPEYFLNVPALLERVRHGVEAKLAERGLAIRKLYEASIEAWRRDRRGEATLPEKLLLTAAHRILFSKIRAQIGPQLRCLICGSAPLSEETQAWFELLGLPVYQVYGLTETTAIVTMDRPRRAVPGKVGAPIDDCEVRLGEGGELQVKGPNVFTGYWGREEATRDAFTEDGYFRTGDQALIDPEGRVSIVGRVKNILVLESGHNVAPEPIEHALVDQIPGVEQAVLVGHGRPYLAVILTGDADRREIGRAIDRFNTELPHYRRIRAHHLSGERFTIENELLTANQKLRRKAIEAHFRSAIDSMYSDEGPRARA